MRRFGSVLAVFALVAVLVVTEIIIIRSGSGYEPQIGVVFAKTRIPENAEITPGMLELRKVALSYAHRMSLRNISEAVAKRAGTDIEAGEMILSGKLNSGGMEAVEVKDAGKRLFSVEFKGDQANGWWLMADQRVNIIYVPDEKPAAGTAQEAAKVDGAEGADMAGMAGITRATGAAGTTETVGEAGEIGGPADYHGGAGGRLQVLEGVRIAALIDENGKILKNSERTALPRYVSFEVTDEQAGLLAYAKGHGRLELSVIPGL